MNLFRLLLLAVAVYVVWRLLKIALRKPAPPGGAQAQRPADEPFETMVRCSSCGTYLPARSLSASGRCGRCSD